MKTQGHRYIELDSLRGLAALTVILGHFLNVFSNTTFARVVGVSPLRIFTAGHEAVILFFLLSGFVLSVPYSKPVRPTYASFLVKRICRVWLPYVVAVALAFFFDRYLYSTTPTGNRWIDLTWNQRPTFHLLIQHLIMIGHFDTAQLNTAFWSLVFEMRISIIYPALFFLSLRFPAKVLLPLSFVATLLVALYAGKHGSEGLSYNILYATFFIVGIFLQRNLTEISDWFRNLSVSTRIALGVGALACFDAPGAFPEATIHGARLVVIFVKDWISLLGAVGILVFAIDWNGFRHFLHSAVVLRLGTISYSIYLVHATVLFVMIRLYYGRSFFPWLFPLYLLITYLLSEAMHRFVERPSMLLGRKLGAVLTPAPRKSKQPV